MKKSILAVGILVGLFIVFFSAGQETQELTNSVEQTGYYKSPNNDRVMALYSNAELAEEDVRAVIKRQTMTSGALFRAVFYSGTSEPLRDGLTLAPDLKRALQVTAEYDYFDWLVMVNPAGDLTVRKH